MKHLSNIDFNYPARGWNRTKPLAASELPQTVTELADLKQKGAVEGLLLLSLFFQSIRWRHITVQVSQKTATSVFFRSRASEKLKMAEATRARPKSGRKTKVL